eukprot:3594725-Rhodomonas_salina.1
MSVPDIAEKEIPQPPTRAGRRPGACTRSPCTRPLSTAHRLHRLAQSRTSHTIQQRARYTMVVPHFAQHARRAIRQVSTGLGLGGA